MFNSVVSKNKFILLTSVFLQLCWTSPAISCTTRYWYNPNTDKYECYDPNISNTRALRKKLNSILERTDTPAPRQSSSGIVYFNEKPKKPTKIILENKSFEVSRSTQNSREISISFRLDYGKDYNDFINRLNSNIHTIVKTIPDYLTNYEKVNIVGWSLEDLFGGTYFDGEAMARKREHGIKITFTRQAIEAVKNDTISKADIIKASPFPLWINPHFRTIESFYQYRNNIGLEKYFRSL